MDWVLYDNDFRHERVKKEFKLIDRDWQSISLMVKQ